MSASPKSKLKEVVNIHYGKGLKKSEREINGKVPVYGANGLIDFHNEYLVHNPTIIIGRKGSIGEVTFSEFGGWPIDTTFYIEIKDSSVLDLRYLFLYLSNTDLKKDAITTSIPGLNRSQLYETEIILPPLDEQKRIAAILDQADALRRKREQSIALLDDLMQSVFIEMFGDPFLNPKGWERKKLSEVGTLGRGKSKHRPRNAPELLGGPYPLIQTGDVSNSKDYITEYTQTYSELGLQQSKLWKAGVLCITIAANIANSAILTFDACFPDSVVGFLPNDLVKTEYVHYWLSFLQKNLEETAPAVAQKNINLTILRGLDIPVPPIDVQDRFVNIVNKNRENTFLNKNSLKILDELFGALQQLAFSG